MKLTPLRDKVLVQLDPEAERKIGRFFLPDQDYITYCSDCGMRSPEPGENPRQRCIPEEIWEDDVLHNRWIPRAIRTAHNITSVTRRTASGQVRTGTVLSVGRLTKHVEPGMRVMVPYMAGGTTENVRIIHEGTILAAVEA